MKHFFAVDRIEGQTVLCEPLGQESPLLCVPLSALPFPVREGDVISSEDGRFFAEPEETKRRRYQLQQRLHRLFDDDGDMD